jgi:hypothetical protein
VSTGLALPVHPDLTAVDLGYPTGNGQTEARAAALVLSGPGVSEVDAEETFKHPLTQVGWNANASVEYIDAQG